MNKILPVMLALIGLAVGGGAGFMLRPTPTMAVECENTEYSVCDVPEEVPAVSNAETEADLANVNYAKLGRQFVVPVVKDGKVSPLVVMSLSIETTVTAADTVFIREPKLRDALLKVMFLHANSGGFDGRFTGGEAMRDLKGSLLQAAREVIGEGVHSVLVTDILRQDL